MTAREFVDLVARMSHPDPRAFDDSSETLHRLITEARLIVKNRQNGIPKGPLSVGCCYCTAGTHRRVVIEHVEDGVAAGYIELPHGGIDVRRRKSHWDAATGRNRTEYGKRSHNWDIRLT